MIRDLIKTDDIAISGFEGKLLAAGYHQVSAARYQRQFSYLLTSFYVVHGDFPRLTKGNVPTGVVDAKYRLEIDTAKFRLSH